MSQSFSNFERQGMEQHETSMGGFGGKMGLILVGAGAVLLIAAGAGAYYVGTLSSSSQPQQQAQAPARPAQQAPAQPQAPTIQWRTVGTFGSWEARCTTPPGRTTQLCTAVLQVINNQNKNVLMSWIVGPDDKGALQSIFQTPTGVMIANGIDVKLGNAAVRKISFQACGPQQCTAAGPMNDAFIKEITANERANVTLTAANGQAMNFGIPVAGFDKAIAAIKK
jgi:invasion protein IalB